MAHYTIGNALRGTFPFEADTDQEAWEKGREIFNTHFSSSSTTGRSVILERHDPAQAKIIEEEGTEYPLKTDWISTTVIVAYGYSGLEWKND